jgi:hypothetical protein
VFPAEIKAMLNNHHETEIMRFALASNFWFCFLVEYEH